MVKSPESLSNHHINPAPGSHPQGTGLPVSEGRGQPSYPQHLPAKRSQGNEQEWIQA
jgi:hypothetical protein